MDSLLTKAEAVDFWTPIFISLKISIISGVLVIIVGTLLANLLARKDFVGKSVVETILLLPLVLPPTVVGFLLIVIFGKKSIIGVWIEWLFHQPLIFTWWAAVIASFIVALPLMYQTAKAGFQNIDTTIEEAARIDGASEWKVFRHISISLASRSLIAGSVLSFARGLGEFGATLMFAGNIPGVTQTVPTAIYIAIDGNNMKMAWLWVISIIFISFIMLFFVQIYQRKQSSV